MNTALPEMLHCANPTVLDRLRARFKGNQQQLFQPHESFLGSNSEQFTDMFSVQSESLHGFLGCDSGLSEVVARSVKPFEASLEQEWPEFATFDVSSVEFGYGTNGPGTCQEMTTQVSCAISRTNSCPPAVAEAKRKESEKLSSAAGKESFTKRKADTLQNGKAIAVEEAKVKKLKGCAEEEESKITEKNSNKSTKNKNKGETSADNSKDNSKNSEVKKPDYIHVRARRGQATDSHSLAERVRREKISERMRYLQDLVPGCNKITGKAGMLDEIINYVQSLQRQVEFLSMKLASVNPKIDFNTDNFFAKGLLPPCGPNFPMMGMSTEIANHNPNTSYLQFNPVQEAISCCGVEIGVSPSDMGLRRTTSAPVSIPDAYFCSSSLPQIQPSLNWDVDLQNLYNMDIQGRLPAYGTQPFTGGVEASNVKMEI